MSDIYSMPAPTDFVPQRVVSLVPSVTESLFDLNLGSRLIAVTTFCERPAEGVAQLPKVGGTKNPNVEQIIALQPDLIIMNDEENRRKDADALQDAGLRIWATGPRTVAEAINLLWEIMDVFDEAAMVPRVRNIERVLDYVSLAARAQTPLRTFVPIWHDPWMSFNTDTYMHDLLANLGLANVFAESDTRYPQISLEEIQTLQPELILLPTEPYNFQETDAEIFYQMNIPAAQHGTIYLVDGSLLTWHGTRLGHALNDLPPLIEEARTRVSNEGDTDS